MKVNYKWWIGYIKGYIQLGMSPDKLYQILGVKLAATMVYHPQGDGQMEWINQELEQFLQLFTNQWQDDWDDLLPVVEFQYNNHIHSATQNIPFLLDTGWIPHMGFELDQQFTCGVHQWVQGEDGRHFERSQGSTG